MSTSFCTNLSDSFVNFSNFTYQNMDKPKLIFHLNFTVRLIECTYVCVIIYLYIIPKRENEKI